MATLLRFRTDDVLLGTSGVGVCMIPSVMCYGYGPPVRRYRSTNIYSAEVGRWHLDGRVAYRFEIGELTLKFFSHLSVLNFCSDASYVFEIKFSGRRPVRWSFFVTGVTSRTMINVIFAV